MLAAMPVASVSRLRGEVLAWPPELADPLPDGPWTVVHVKPRQEKLLVSNLRYLQVPSLLLLEHVERVYVRQGRQVNILPLLPGYLFVQAGEEAYHDIYATERVVRLFNVRHPADLCRDLTDLIALVRRAEEPLLVRPELVPGTVVMLTAGSLAGLRGVVDRRKGRCELVVNVRLLGTSVAVACAAADVEEAQVQA